MPLSAGDIVARVAPAANPVYVQAFADRQGLLSDFGITTPLRIAHFVAQAFVETGGFVRLVESGRYSKKALAAQWDKGNWHRAFATRDECLSYADKCRVDGGVALFNLVYAANKDLGNTRPGDGWKFRGRGIIQTTGRSNYTALGKAFKVGFVDDPDLVATPEHALKAALGHWRDRYLNTAADANDIAVITRGINGGLTALPERKAAFARIYAIASQAAPIETSVEWRVQDKLNAAGFPCGKPDGVVGSGTRSAILAYRAAHRLPMTTAITADLLASLGLG